jgi:DNA polymerase-3 subunit alpha
MSFVHLHVHSQYSWLDGACYSDKLIDLAVKDEMPALAITDRNSIAGAINFSFEAKEKGIKPIIGLEIEVLNDISDGRAFSVILLAKDSAGFYNLSRLITLAYEYDSQTPKITKTQLSKHYKGLICLSFSVVGELCTLLLEDKEEEALQVSNWYQSIFGDDYYYEIHNHGLPREAIAMNKLLNMASITKIPLVLANDCHYLEHKDTISIDVINCIRKDLDFANPEAKRFACNEYYFKNSAEMKNLYTCPQQLLSNSLHIADKIELDLTEIFPNEDSFKENNSEIRQEIIKAICEKNDLLNLNKICNNMDFELIAYTEYIPWTSEELKTEVLKVLGVTNAEVLAMTKDNYLYSHANMIAEKMGKTWKEITSSNNAYVLIPKGVSLPLVTDCSGKKRCQFAKETLNKMGLITWEIS